MSLTYKLLGVIDPTTQAMEALLRVLTDADEAHSIARLFDKPSETVESAVAFDRNAVDGQEFAMMVGFICHDKGGSHRPALGLSLADFLIGVSFGPKSTLVGVS